MASGRLSAIERELGVTSLVSRQECGEARSQPSERSVDLFSPRSDAMPARRSDLLVGTDPPVWSHDELGLLVV